MIGIFVLALIVVAIAAAVGYSLLSDIKTGEMISMAGRNAPRMDAIVSAVAAAARPLSGGQPVLPAPSADAAGRAVVPAWVSADSSTPWGVPYGYCPYAVPDRTDIASQPVEAIGGQGERRPLSTVSLRAEGADRPFVVVGARAGREDEDAGAPKAAAFILSPVPGASEVPDCGAVFWKDGWYRVMGVVPEIENGGRISSIPRYAGAQTVTPTVTLGGGEPRTILSRTSFGSRGATVDDEDIDAGLVRVSESCEGASCSASCPSDRRIVSDDCEGPGPGWVLNAFGTGGGSSSWSCNWSQISAQQAIPVSTARAACARLR